MQIEYDDRAKASPLKDHAKVVVAKKAAPQIDDEGDDVDIDAI